MVFVSDISTLCYSSYQETQCREMSSSRSPRLLSHPHLSHKEQWRGVVLPRQMLTKLLYFRKEQTVGLNSFTNCTSNILYSSELSQSHPSILPKKTLYAKLHSTFKQIQQACHEHNKIGEDTTSIYKHTDKNPGYAYSKF